MNDDRIVIDTTTPKRTPAPKEADLIIEMRVEVQENGQPLYVLRYSNNPQKELAVGNRKSMLREHVEAIRASKPKTVVVRTSESVDVFLPQETVAKIVSGELGVDELLLSRER